jgi:RimJ/RimL family protein N-acetyltransferase
VILFGRATQRIPDIRTARLRLIAITDAMLSAEEADDGSFRRLLRARITEQWPPEHWEPHVLTFIRRQHDDDPRTIGWNRYVLQPSLHRRPTLVGCVGGFIKPGGEVEIGYSTLPSFQRRGYATEAARAFVEWLLMQEDVRRVTAQTFPHMPESIKVMERCGMTYIGDGDDPGTVKFGRKR